MEAMSATLLQRVKRLLPPEDAQRRWGHPALSTTPTPLAIEQLARRVEALEEAVRQIAAEVQELSPQTRQSH